MMKASVTLFVLLIAGCASPPNTPGAGIGKNYTPIIDMRGMDGARYMTDLDACRNSAAMIDADKQELFGLIGGALIGAAYGASISRDSRVIGAGANSGALSGGLHAGANARSRQQIVMGNCMASRGYRVIDGTAQLSFVQVMQQPSQPVAGQPIVGQPVTWTPAPPAPQAAAVPDGIVRLPTPAASPPVRLTGTDSYAADRIARDAKCNSTDVSTLVAKGPGYESYSMQCTNGDVMMIRCEFGNCRALR